MDNFVLSIILSLVFIIGNMLDTLTTYLAIHRLPIGLRSHELNPIAKHDVECHFPRTVLFKGITTLLVLGIFWRFASDYGSLLFLLKIADLFVGFVVANNAYIYLAKRIKHKPVMTIGIFLTRICHLPEVVAFLVVSVVLLSLSYAVAIVL